MFRVGVTVQEVRFKPLKLDDVRDQRLVCFGRQFGSDSSILLLFLVYWSLYTLYAY